MKKIWDDRAWEEYLYWQTQDKRTLRKINSLLRDIERSGGIGIGQTELLKCNPTGWSSAKIDDKNRLVYRIIGDAGTRVLEILQCKNHYR
jgi:toxin YoeB